MIDYDVMVQFTDGSTETIPVHASNALRALVTATYRMEKWPFQQQSSIVMVHVHAAVRNVAALVKPVPEPVPAVAPRPKLVRRR